MEKKSNGKNIVIALLSILLIVSLVFIGYDKLLKKDNNTSPNNQTEETKQLENTKDAATIFYENMVKNRKVTVDYDNGIEIVLDKDGNVYYSTNKKVEGKVEQKSSYTIDDYIAGIDENGKMSNILNGYKLNISGVVSMYHVWIGNGGYQGYIFIKDNGTIGKLTYDAYLDFNKNEILKIVDFEETVTGYKNIISVETSNSWDAHGYNLIDIDGNIYQ